MEAERRAAEPMAGAVASVPTASASRYLQQLCKHWSHRFEVSFDASAGRIALPRGVCALRALPEALDIRIEAPEASDLEGLGEVVAEHLRRFAFRETLEIAFRPA